MSFINDDDEYGHSNSSLSVEPQDHDIPTDEVVVKNGYHKFTFFSGDEYSGEWKDDRMHGEGSLNLNISSEHVGSHVLCAFTGTFEEGIPVKGTGEWADTSTFEGCFVDGIPSGPGVFRKGAISVTGTFVNGEATGSVVISLKTSEGEYLYKGSLSDGLLSGDAVVHFPDNSPISTLNATFERGIKVGKYTVTFKDPSNCPVLVPPNENMCVSVNIPRSVSVKSYTWNRALTFTYDTVTHEAVIKYVDGSVYRGATVFASSGDISLPDNSYDYNYGSDYLLNLLNFKYYLENTVYDIAREGKGVFSLCDGSRLSTDVWHDNDIFGDICTVEYPDGSLYRGAMKSGERVGMGVFINGTSCMSQPNLIESVVEPSIRMGVLTAIFVGDVPHGITHITYTNSKEGYTDSEKAFIVWLFHTYKDSVLISPQQHQPHATVFNHILYPSRSLCSFQLPLTYSVNNLKLDLDSFNTQVQSQTLPLTHVLPSPSVDEFETDSSSSSTVTETHTLSLNSPAPSLSLSPTVPVCFSGLSYYGCKDWGRQYHINSTIVTGTFIAPSLQDVDEIIGRHQAYDALGAVNYIISNIRKSDRFNHYIDSSNLPSLLRFHSGQVLYSPWVELSDDCVETSPIVSVYCGGVDQYLRRKGKGVLHMLVDRVSNSDIFPSHATNKYIPAPTSTYFIDAEFLDDVCAVGSLYYPNSQSSSPVSSLTDSRTKWNGAVHSLFKAITPSNSPANSPTHANADEDASSDGEGVSVVGKIGDNQKDKEITQYKTFLKSATVADMLMLVQNRNKTTTTKLELTRLKESNDSDDLFAEPDPTSPILMGRECLCYAAGYGIMTYSTDSTNVTYVGYVDNGVLLDGVHYTASPSSSKVKSPVPRRGAIGTNASTPTSSPLPSPSTDSDLTMNEAYIGEVVSDKQIDNSLLSLIINNSSDSSTAVSSFLSSISNLLPPRRHGVGKVTFGNLSRRSNIGLFDNGVLVCGKSVDDNGDMYIGHWNEKGEKQGKFLIVLFQRKLLCYVDVNDMSDDLLGKGVIVYNVSDAILTEYSHFNYTNIDDLDVSRLLSDCVAEDIALSYSPSNSSSNTLDISPSPSPSPTTLNEDKVVVGMASVCTHRDTTDHSDALLVPIYSDTIQSLVHSLVVRDSNSEQTEQTVNLPRVTVDDQGMVIINTDQASMTFADALKVVPGFRYRALNPDVQGTLFKHYYTGHIHVDILPHGSGKVYGRCWKGSVFEYYEGSFNRGVLEGEGFVKYNTVWSESDLEDSGNSVALTLNTHRQQHLISCIDTFKGTFEDGWPCVGELTYVNPHAYKVQPYAHYQGEMSYGLPHGNGVFTYNNQAVFKGVIDCNKPYEGVLTTVTGDSYTGAMHRQDKFNSFFDRLKSEMLSMASESGMELNGLVKSIVERHVKMVDAVQPWNTLLQAVNYLAINRDVSVPIELGKINSMYHPSPNDENLQLLQQSLVEYVEDGSVLYKLHDTVKQILAYSQRSEDDSVSVSLTDSKLDSLIAKGGVDSLILRLLLSEDIPLPSVIPALDHVMKTNSSVFLLDNPYSLSSSISSVSLSEVCITFNGDYLVLKRDRCLSLFCGGIVNLNSDGVEGAKTYSIDTSEENLSSCHGVVLQSIHSQSMTVMDITLKCIRNLYSNYSFPLYDPDVVRLGGSVLERDPLHVLPKINQGEEVDVRGITLPIQLPSDVTDILKKIDNSQATYVYGVDDLDDDDSKKDLHVIDTCSKLAPRIQHLDCTLSRLALAMEYAWSKIEGVRCMLELDSQAESHCISTFTSWNSNNRGPANNLSMSLDRLDADYSAVTDSAKNYKTVATSLTVTDSDVSIDNILHSSSTESTDSALSDETVTGLSGYLLSLPITKFNNTLHTIVQTAPTRILTAGNIVRLLSTIDNLHREHYKHMIFTKDTDDVAVLLSRTLVDSHPSQTSTETWEQYESYAQNVQQQTSEVSEYINKGKSRCLKLLNVAETNTEKHSQNIALLKRVVMKVILPLLNTHIDTFRTLFGNIQSLLGRVGDTAKTADRVYMETEVAVKKNKEFRQDQTKDLLVSELHYSVVTNNLYNLNRLLHDNSMSNNELQQFDLHAYTKSDYLPLSFKLSDGTEDTVKLDTSSTDVTADSTDDDKTATESKYDQLSSDVDLRFRSGLGETKKTPVIDRNGYFVGKGNSALHLAIQRGLCDVVLLLYYYNVNIVQRDARGKSPLTIALEHKHPEILPLLKKCGYNLDRVDQYSDKVDDPSLVDSITGVKATTDPNASAGNSLLHSAAYLSDFALVKLLLSVKCDVNLRNNHGQTPLMLVCKRAAELGDAALSSPSYSHTVSPHDKKADKAGNSWTELNHIRNIIEVLLQSGARVNLVDSLGNSAMHYLNPAAHVPPLTSSSTSPSPLLTLRLILGAYGSRIKTLRNKQNIPVVPSSDRNALNPARQQFITLQPSFNGELVLHAGHSLWVSDEVSSTCQECEQEFGLFNRRHHCRITGTLVCSSCVEGSVLAAGVSNVPHKALSHAINLIRTDIPYHINGLGSLADAGEEAVKKDHGLLPGNTFKLSNTFFNSNMTELLNLPHRRRPTGHTNASKPHPNFNANPKFNWTDVASTKLMGDPDIIAASQRSKGMEVGVTGQANLGGVQTYIHDDLLDDLV